MRVKLIDENNIIVFLSSYNIENVNFDSKTELEKELKTLFRKLSLIYDLKLYGYYNVSIFIDKYYGVVLTLEKEELDYIDYDIDEIDMRIIISKNDFLYCLSNFVNIDTMCTIYLYKGKYYLKLEEQIDNYNMGNLLEHSKLIYDKTEDIIKYGTILKNMDYVL